MAGKKNHYYILVLSNQGPVFVTGIPERNWCEWNKEKAPMEFGTEKYAEEVAWGLRLNLNTAFMIKSKYEITKQPYRYEDGEFKWVWKKDAENN